MELKGKTALITGGAVRVGKAITLALARAGCNVAVHYNSSAGPAEATVAEARALGVQAASFKADLADAAQAQALVDNVESSLGPLGAVVYSASLFDREKFPTDDFATWKRVTAISIDGAFYTLNAAGRSMLARGEGAIVSILDLSIERAWRGYTAHAVGKSGLQALTRQLAVELAPAVRANAIVPGDVLPPPDFTPEQIEQSKRHNALGRWGTPEDIANAAVFLLQADYITGEVLHVDGGASIR